MKKFLIFLVLLGGCSIVDKMPVIPMEKDAVFHTESEAVHTEPDTFHVPVWVTSNGNIYPYAFTGAVQGTLNIHNNGKPLVLVTNEGKPLVLITNEGKPLITNTGPLIENKGKPLITNNGPLVSFFNQGKPLIETHFDTGPLTKTVDNSIYIVVIVLVVAIIALCGVGIWYIINLHKNYHVTRKPNP